ncbi:hypothetical protein MUP37_02160 [Candidatus Bathyarchaeota archaeon]|nr:hypothetical protein [Candidatus Bathyarchaeota archaeon]
MSHPSSEQIRIVIECKKRIEELTGKILDSIEESKSNEMGRDRQELLIKKCVAGIVTEISTIAGFCGKNEREFVSKMTRDIYMVTEYSELSPLLEDWCILMAGITPDFTRTPFRFMNSELTSQWSKIGDSIRAIAGR